MFLPVQSKCGFFDSAYALVKLLVIFCEFEAMFFPKLVIYFPCLKILLDNSDNTFQNEFAHF